MQLLILTCIKFNEISNFLTGPIFIHISVSFFQIKPILFLTGPHVYFKHNLFRVLPFSRLIVFNRESIIRVDRGWMAKRLSRLIANVEVKVQG